MLSIVSPSANIAPAAMLFMFDNATNKNIFLYFSSQSSHLRSLLIGETVKLNLLINLFTFSFCFGSTYDASHSTQLVKSTFRQAYETRQPQQNLIFHSDRGTNYRSYSFCSYLKSLHVEQSFSRTHTPYDNSVIESFFSSMKREELYRTKYRSEYELRKAIDDYVTFYNTKRPHSKNQNKTPMVKEKEYYSET